MEKVAMIDYVGKKAGMDYYNLGLLNSLSKNNTEVFLYSNFISSNPGIHFHSVFGTFYRFRVVQLFNFLYAMIYACISCKRNKVRYVILHLFSTQLMSFLSFLFCKLFGLKIITISHDVSSFAKDDNTFFRYLIYQKWSDRIVVHNKFSYDALCSTNLSVKHKISIIKHGSFTHMPDSSVDKLKAREKLNLDKKTPYILFFGQIKKVKKLDVLLNSMQAVNEPIKLIVAGKVWKDNFDHYQNIINRNNLEERVILDIQFISDEKRELYFKAVDLIVLPYEEIYQSGVLLMSMSYSMASVVSNIPPFKEIIEDGKNGYFFEKNNPTSLAQVINQVFTNPAKLEAVKKEALKTMLDHYSWDEIAKKYTDFF